MFLSKRHFEFFLPLFVEALLHCEMFHGNLSRNVLATLWPDKLHKTFHGVTAPLGLSDVLLTAK